MRLILTNEDKKIINSFFNDEGKIVRKNREQNYDRIIDVKKKLETIIQYQDFEFITRTDEEIKEIEEYLQKVTKIRTNSTFCSIQGLAQSFEYMWKIAEYYDGKEVSIWTMRDFIDKVRDYFEINDKKSSYKMAWGWNHFQEKEKPRAYLYAIVRNYLKKNEVYSEEVMRMIGSMEYCHEHYEEYMKSVKL